MALVLGEQLNKHILEVEKNEARNNQTNFSTKDKLASLRNDSLQKIEVIKKIKDVRKILRIINLAFAASFVGLVVTYFIMSVQIFVGNLLGVKTIALEGIEIGIYAALSFLILLLVIMVIMGAMFIVGPWLKIIGFLQDALNSIIGN